MLATGFLLQLLQRAVLFLKASYLMMLTVAMLYGVGDR
jgi:hypothetical protein